MSSFQIFTDAEKASVRKGGKILQECLAYVSSLVEPGITTGFLDAKAEAFIRDHGGRPAFKGYHGYPATLCASVNEECVHGIPGARMLEEGDLFSIDGGVIFDDLFTDACLSVAVGEIAPEGQRLLEVTREALRLGLEVLRAGARLGDISSAIQDSVESQGMKIVKALTGHGLGRTLHQFPDIPNFGKRGTGPSIPAGTLLAIEPIVSISSAEILQMPDGWTIVTRDGSLCAHFEHTVLVGEEGCEIVA